MESTNIENNENNNEQISNPQEDDYATITLNPSVSKDCSSFPSLPIVRTPSIVSIEASAISHTGHNQGKSPIVILPDDFHSYETIQEVANQINAMQLEQISIPKGAEKQESAENAESEAIPTAAAAIMESRSEIELPDIPDSWEQKQGGGGAVGIEVLAEVKNYKYIDSLNMPTLTESHTNSEEVTLVPANVEQVRGGDEATTTNNPRPAPETETETKSTYETGKSPPSIPSVEVSEVNGQGYAAPPVQEVLEVVTKEKLSHTVNPPEEIIPKGEQPLSLNPVERRARNASLVFISERLARVWLAFAGLSKDKEQNICAISPIRGLAGTLCLALKIPSPNRDLEAAFPKQEFITFEEFAVFLARILLEAHKDFFATGRSIEAGSKLATASQKGDLSSECVEHFDSACYSIWSNRFISSEAPATTASQGKGLIKDLDRLGKQTIERLLRLFFFFAERDASGRVMVGINWNTLVDRIKGKELVKKRTCKNVEMAEEALSLVPEKVEPEAATIHGPVISIEEIVTLFDLLEKCIGYQLSRSFKLRQAIQMEANKFRELLQKEATTDESGQGPNCKRNLNETASPELNFLGFLARFRETFSEAELDSVREGVEELHEHLVQGIIKRGILAITIAPPTPTPSSGTLQGQSGENNSARSPGHSPLIRSTLFFRKHSSASKPRELGIKYLVLRQGTLEVYEKEADFGQGSRACKALAKFVLNDQSSIQLTGTPPNSSETKRKEKQQDKKEVFRVLLGKYKETLILGASDARSRREWISAIERSIEVSGKERFTFLRSSRVSSIPAAAQGPLDSSMPPLSLVSSTLSHGSSDGWALDEARTFLERCFDRQAALKRLQAARADRARAEQLMRSDKKKLLEQLDQMRVQSHQMHLLKVSLEEKLVQEKAKSKLEEEAQKAAISEIEKERKSLEARLEEVAKRSEELEKNCTESNAELKRERELQTELHTQLEQVQKYSIEVESALQDEFKERVDVEFKLQHQLGALEVERKELEKKFHEMMTYSEELRTAQSELRRRSFAQASLLRQLEELTNFKKELEQQVEDERESRKIAQEKQQQLIVSLEGNMTSIQGQLQEALKRQDDLEKEREAMQRRRELVRPFPNLSTRALGESGAEGGAKANTGIITHRGPGSFATTLPQKQQTDLNTGQQEDPI